MLTVSIASEHLPQWIIYEIKGAGSGVGFRAVSPPFGVNQKLEEEEEEEKEEEEEDDDDDDDDDYNDDDGALRLLTEALFYLSSVADR